jgi:hypothetical protein
MMVRAGSVDSLVVLQCGLPVGVAPAMKVLTM